jgi:hypothetical protein
MYAPGPAQEISILTPAQKPRHIIIIIIIIIIIMIRPSRTIQ